MTVTPLIAASAAPIDVKQVRIRGPLLSVDAADTRFTTGIVPFDFAVAGAGQLVISPSDATTYDINGAASTGAAGLAQLGGLATGTMTFDSRHADLNRRHQRRRPTATAPPRPPPPPM